MNSSSRSELDLRAYLQYVRTKGKNAYLEVVREISPRWETTAVVSELARKMRNPVVYFQDIANCDYPMVANVCCAIERVANSVGLSGQELNKRFTHVMENRIAPEVISSRDAPVREITRDTGTFSLKEFPQLYYTATQTEPYLTAALIVARDPDTGAHNISFHRLMICSDHSAAIFMTPEGHLDQIWRKNNKTAEATPLAVVLGAHPLWSYASLLGGPLEHDDYSILGAVLGSAVRLTEGTLDKKLLVPAHAEIILEGEIEPTLTHDEGPFGEFLGYVAERSPKPVVRFKAMTSRSKPIFHDIVAGGAEHLTMSSITLRARLERDYFSDNEAVKDFLLPAAMTLFLAIDESRQQDFDANRLMKDLLDAERYLKQVVCFDAEVDLRKQTSVQTALACHVQADRDVRIFRNHNGNGIDPSEIGGMTTKMSIDARVKTKLVKNALPKEFFDQFCLTDWID